MSYMMSRDGYLNDRDGHRHPHLMFFLPLAEPASWGADLPGSPVLGAQDPPAGVTIFFVPVGRWSDGTNAPQHEHAACRIRIPGPERLRLAAAQPWRTDAAGTARRVRHGERRVPRARSVDRRDGGVTTRCAARRSATARVGARAGGTSSRRRRRCCAAADFAYYIASRCGANSGAGVESSEAAAVAIAGFCRANGAACTSCRVVPACDRRARARFSDQETTDADRQRGELPR